MSQLNSPMVALRNARLRYREYEPSERFSKGDRIRCFAGTHAGRVGTVKNVGTRRLTMSWDDDPVNKKNWTFCDAIFAELLSDYLDAQATAPPSTMDDVVYLNNNNNNNRNTGTRSDPEHTHGTGTVSDEAVYDMIEKRLNDLTVDLVAMLRMCDNPGEAWKEMKLRVDALLLWHKDEGQS